MTGIPRLNMVQAITVLTVLKMLTNAQTACNLGNGRVVYERLPDQQLQNFDDDVVKDTAPPFRVLEKCQELCLRDRSAVSNVVRTCSSFDFQPGSRIASFTGAVEYEESSCQLSYEQASPDGHGTLVLSPNSVHYNEVCLSSSRIERECPYRHYVFERHPRKKFKPPVNEFKEVAAVNRTDCEDKCLNEYAFVCRSATFDLTARTCWLSKHTRRSYPELMEEDPNFEYLENTCLNAERRCDGPIIFVKEDNRRLGGPFEVDIYTNISLSECQAQCLKGDKFFCRAVEYDEQLMRCIIFEEDSLSQKDDLRVSNSPAHDLYDLVCLGTDRGNEFAVSENVANTLHLFQEGRATPPNTAFQRYRHSRPGSESHTEMNIKSLSDCLDECLRQVSFQCRSAAYSEKFKSCRLYKFNMMNKDQKLIYDPDHDYYENLMANGGVGPNVVPVSRPDTQGQAAYPGHQVVKPAGGFPGVYVGGSYPGYAGPASSNQAGVPYSPPAYMTGGGGYYPPYGNNAPHGADISPYGVSPSGVSSGYHAGPITSTPSLGYSAAVPPSVHAGSLSPVGASSIAPYPSPFAPPGPAFYPGYDNRPFNVRCNDQEQFKQAGVHKKMKRQYMRRGIAVPTLAACEKECMESLDFICRSFNYRATPYGATRDNCELSDRDSRDMDMANANYFDNAGDYDFYERSAMGRHGQDCLDVSQTCSEDGMEFTLKTPEGFLGRIFTHGFYDRCYQRGNGGLVNVLRISGAQGYPDCGTIRFGDTMTNIVVVQFSDFVQTSKDKRYNLTCLFRGPGEAVVTSHYMTASAGSPVPIEYLPAENSLSSRVRLQILYQGRPTNTIAVGDPLTFRLEGQDGYNYATDIFATNVVARDPYSGRSVTLIDQSGCPVYPDIFPSLDRAREGDGLEARFEAFKLAESSFLVFEATVKTCREGCSPAYCGGSTGRAEQSLGRRKREIDDATDQLNEMDERSLTIADPANTSDASEERVKRMIEVFESRDDITTNAEAQSMQPVMSTVCLTNREYYGMIMVMLIFMALMITITITAGIYYKRYWLVASKNVQANDSSGVLNSYMYSHSLRSESPHPRYTPSARSLFSLPSLKSENPLKNLQKSEAVTRECLDKEELPGVSDATQEDCLQSFKDTTEPIYTDLSLFERSRSLRSLSINIENINKDR